MEHLNLAESEPDNVVAFMGTENNRLEMLFLSTTEKGKGIGKQIIQYGILNYGIKEVTVNVG